MSETITPSVEIDHASWDAFERLALALVRGEQATDPPPVIRVEEFKGLTDIATDLVERRRQQGVAAVWRGLAAVIAMHPEMARRLTRSIEELPAPMRKLVVYTAAQLKALPPVQFLDSERIIQANGITMVVGKPGTGKSLWMLRKLDEISLTVPVLIVAAEAQGGLGDRVTALEMANRRLVNDHFHIAPQSFNLLAPDAVTALIDYARSMQVRVIAFDTYAAVTAGSDENTVRDVSPIFGVLGRIKEEVGCAILLLHHTRKDGGVYRGSSAIEGALDNLYILVDDEGTIILKPEKTRDTGKPQPLYYRIVQFHTRDDDGKPVHAPALLPSSKVVDEDPVQDRVSDHERKVLEALDAFEEGMSVKELAEATALNRHQVNRTLQNLMKLGLVSHAAWGEPYVLTQEGHLTSVNRTSSQ